MKKINLMLLLIFSLIACDKKNNYKYIAIVDDESITGDLERKEEEAVIIEAENDSLAYLEAYQKFKISEKIYLDNVKYNIKTFTIPIGYKLLDEKDSDIMLLESRINLVKGKAEIDKSLSEINTGVSKIAEDIKPVSKIDSAKIKELKSFFNYKTDEFTNETWVSPKSAPKYRNRNAVYCCFISKNNNAENFRIQFQYTNEDWLFIEKCQFLIDGKTFEYTPKEVKRDNGEGGIWEWFDEGINYGNIDLIEALASAKKAKVKIIGSQYHDVKTISSKDLDNINKSLSLYKAMGGRF